MPGMLDWFGSWICVAFYSNATMVGVKEDYIRYTETVSLLSWKCGSKWMWFSCLINLRPCWCLMYAIKHALHWFWSKAFILFCPCQSIFQYLTIVLYVSACYQKLMLWMISQSLSYIYTWRWCLWYKFSVAIFCYKYFYDEDWCLWREFVSSVATHGHYASDIESCKLPPFLR